MNNYGENETFGFEPENVSKDFDYNDISGLGESNYENEDLFNIETSNVNTDEAFDEPKNPVEENSWGDLGYNLEVPLDYNETEKDATAKETDGSDYEPSFEIATNESDEETTEENNQVTNFMDYNSINQNLVEEPFSENEAAENIVEEDIPFEFNNINNDQELDKQQENSTVETQESTKKLDEDNSGIIDTSFLESNTNFDSSSLENNFEYPVVEPTLVQSKEEVKKEKFIETPIEELNKLIEFEEENIQTTDINSLFDRVGVNVKEASDIFKKNTEMKEKLDSRFEELKKLQAEVEKAKKSQYDEINSYKEEVLGKLTEKKEEIEKRINRLKEFQASLEEEKTEFEQYRKREKEEIEKVQKEVQEAYDSRRDELNHIEDVLRKQKDALDEERSQLSLDRIQYEADKNELANNLLKFNEIVDSFTNGVDKINKE